MDSSMTELNDNNKNNRIFDVPWLDSSYYETLFPLVQISKLLKYSFITLNFI